jgi:hypothetical protein
MINICAVFKDFPMAIPICVLFKKKGSLLLLILIYLSKILLTLKP